MMKEGSAVDDNESNVIGTTTQYSDGATLVHAMGSALPEVDQPITTTRYDAPDQDDVGSREYQRSMDEERDQRSVDGERETQLENELVSGSLNSLEGKDRASTGHTFQPGAMVMAGSVDERNNSNPSSPEKATSNSREPQDAAIKPTATLAMGLDQVETVSIATSHNVIAKGDNTLEHRCDSTVVLVNHAEDSEDDVTSSAMVEAELVMPPVEAVRVSIDEDPAIAWNHVQPFELEHAPSGENTDGTRSKKYGHIFWVLLSLLVVIVLCATLVPYTLHKDDGSEVGSTSPGPNSYGCYTSLADILNAQVLDADLDDPTYIICPNTKIKVGTMVNPAADDFRYFDGDYPIMVTRENVTIQCGLDGRRDNNCVIDAGFMHVLTLQHIAMPDGTLTALANRTNDNLLIRGITFTGIPINVGPFRGSSVSLSHPGKNMRFEDCLWYNMTAPSGLIGVYRNYYQVLVDLPLDDLSIEVTFADCVFENVVFDSPLIFVRNQAIKLERCIFRNIQLSVLTEEYCRYFTGDEAEVVETNQGCATLLNCASQSHCSMKDICVHDGIEIKGQGIVVIHNDTTFQHEGLYLEPNSTTATCEMAILSNLDGSNFTCTYIFEEPSCPLSLNSL